MSRHRRDPARRLSTTPAAAHAALVAFALLAVSQIGFAMVTAWASATDREIVVVTGGSMEPAFSAGDAIVVGAANDTVREGDIVTFRTDQGLVTHRVISRTTVGGQPHLQTRGDANSSPDPNLVPLGDVVGVVEKSIPAGGHVVLFLTSPVGRVITLAPFLLWLAFAETRRAIRIWREHPAAEAAAQPSSA